MQGFQKWPGIALFDAFYRSGALVFGGGHVVLPLLREAFVTPGWVSDDAFLAGYGAAQAVPGPLFTFAAYLGVTLPKPMTSNSKAAGRFGKQDFRYVAAEDAYVCPAGQGLAYSFTTEDRGVVLRRYRTNACQSCAIKHRCTTGKERLISRWEHEAVLETVQARLDQHPEKMTMRRQTAEHPFGTIKCWMGASMCSPTT